MLNSSMRITVSLEIVPCGLSHGHNKVLLIKITTKLLLLSLQRKKHGNIIGYKFKEIPAS